MLKLHVNTILCKEDDYHENYHSTQHTWIVEVELRIKFAYDADTIKAARQERNAELKLNAKLRDSTDR